MNVDFNNLRKKACKCCDRLITNLNKAIDNETNAININCDTIEDDLNELKVLIGSIAAVYEEGNEKFKDVFDELYPDDKTMVDFNSID